MAIGVKRRLTRGEKCPHKLVLARLIQEEPVVGLVLLIGEDCGDVDQFVVAILHGKDIHNPVPLSLEMASVHRHDLCICDRDRSFGELLRGNGESVQVQLHCCCDIR